MEPKELRDCDEEVAHAACWNQPGKQAGGVHRFSLSRSDRQVTLDGVAIKVGGMDAPLSMGTAIAIHNHMMVDEPRLFFMRF